jgi:hypothetical protein
MLIALHDWRTVRLAFDAAAAIFATILVVQRTRTRSSVGGARNVRQAWSSLRE